MTALLFSVIGSSLNFVLTLVWSYPTYPFKLDSGPLIAKINASRQKEEEIKKEIICLEAVNKSIRNSELDWKEKDEVDKLLKEIKSKQESADESLVSEKEALIKAIKGGFDNFYETLKKTHTEELEKQSSKISELTAEVSELKRKVKEKQSDLEKKDAAIDKLEKMKDDAATHMFESIKCMDQVRGEDATPLQKAEDITDLWPKIVEHTFAAATLLLGQDANDETPHENEPSST